MNEDGHCIRSSGSTINFYMLNSFIDSCITMANKLVPPDEGSSLILATANNAALGGMPIAGSTMKLDMTSNTTIDCTGAMSPCADDDTHIDMGG